MSLMLGFDLASSETNLAHEQKSAQGSKYTHYSMDEFFYPRLLLAFTPTAPIKPPIRKGPQWNWSQILTALLVIICVALLINLRQTQLQLSAALRSANTIETDPVPGIHHEPVHTITITTTATLEAPTASSARWRYPSAEPQQQQQDAAHPTPSPAAPDDDASLQPPPPSSSENMRPLPTITPIALAAPDAGGALTPFHSFSALWSLRLELPPIPDIRLPDVANITLQSMLTSLDTVYQLFRKVLHYPLDPP